MGIDRALSLGAQPPLGKVIILERPGETVAMPTAAHIHP